MKKLLFTLMTVLSFAGILNAQDITGTWYGTLNIGSQKMRLVFHIDRTDDGYTTVMDSPDQGQRGIRTTSTVFDGKKLKVTADELRMTYEGTLDGDEFKGVFRQFMTSAQLKFTRETIVLSRPQTPQPPFPYQTEDVRFRNETDDITLAGTVTIPQGEGPFPAVILISGSGAQNRDEEIMEHKPFFVIADRLTRNGIAVLRYDDRGYGESEGVYATATIDNFALDALSARDYLRGRPEIDMGKIGLLGHSEGVSVAYKIAGIDEEGLDIAFVVALAGLASDATEALREQRRLILGGSGHTDEMIEENERLLNSMQAIADSYPTEYLYENIEELALTLVPEEMRDNREAVNQYVRGLASVISPEYQSLIKYDPAEDLARITCPIFALSGSLDTQVPSRWALDPLGDAAVNSAGVKTRKYEGLNHLFQHAVTGMPIEYTQIEETISEEVLSDITEWITSVAKSDFQR